MATIIDIENSIAKLTEDYLRADSVQETDRIKNITRVLLNMKNSID
jgi:hypothetical protein